MKESERAQAIAQIREELKAEFSNYDDLIESAECLLKIVDSQAQKISEQAKEIERLKKILCDDLHYWNAFRTADGKVHVK